MGNRWIPPLALGVVSRTAKVYGLRAVDLRGRSKTPRCVLARHVAMFAMRERLGYSYPQVGRYFNRDHSTVMYACRKVRERMKIDTAFARTVADAIGPDEPDSVLGIGVASGRAAKLIDEVFTELAEKMPTLDVVLWAQACRVSTVSTLSAPELYAQLVISKTAGDKWTDAQILDAVQYQHANGLSASKWRSHLEGVKRGR